MCNLCNCANVRFGLVVVAQRESKSATTFVLPGICVKMKSILKTAAINHKFLAHVARTVSLSFPV